MTKMTALNALDRIANGETLYILKPIDWECSVREICNFASEGILYRDEPEDEKPIEKEMPKPSKSELTEDEEAFLADFYGDDKEALTEASESTEKSPARNRGRMPNSVKEEVLRRYNSGELVVDIAPMVGYSVGYCHKVIHNAKENGGN